MKKLLCLLIATVISFVGSAQIHYQDAKNSEILRHIDRQEPFRREIILPQVNGYTAYKADLHTHTIFSDGSVMPKFRVQEAWEDGFDVLAITEHIESRLGEKIFVEYLQKYIKEEYPKALNTFIALEPTPKGSIMVDLNFSYKLAKEEAKRYGLLVIPGAEISRDGAKIGHFNALFTTDANTIYDPDALTSIRNAKRQNALVMHNHPGYRRTNIDYTEVEKVAYDEGLIDGVEVMNGSAFYAGVVDRVRERSLFIAACTDVHGAAASSYRHGGNNRSMTIIFAKDKSLEAMREALEARRTLAWAFDTVCGDEQLLKDLFTASVKVEVIRKSDSGVEFSLTNLTSVPYFIRQSGENIKKLAPFTSFKMKIAKGEKSLKLEVINLYCGADKHPVIELPILH